MTPSAVLGAMPALAVAKNQLRTQMKQQLKSLPAASVSLQSAAIHGALLRFPPFADARRVAVFLSMPAAEVQTDAIVRHALAAGKQVFVPYLHKPAATIAADDYIPPRIMDMVQLHDLADYEALERDSWGIPSVSASSVPTRTRVLGDDPREVGETNEDGEGKRSLSALDLILMPGVAFDVHPETRRIHRCGHGRGFYDYFLHRYALKTAAAVPPPSQAVRLYGLALSEQVLPAHSVPIGPHDQPLDGLITGDGAIITPEAGANTKQ
ncbi:5-formyltetrahydrofolate cyclo-ligase [Sporothrix brasiliensis 5110]|uniref:5-formyltetrahydrofolate cyclo-ligase n=1 Tax=Sporothrix brasiliensis 5110 TaxID=1398154 RepID=A0A0C2IPQ0_9PEZI|nr:5-formyltetrahydrofolate cyclo-ligase [Sporothrix brasiliensis 5110]KIH88915.1 5-formyltetrahydrofolate cyclo-ligase [Sporothrix brasiliensis 5110]